jgi:polar amino acid transport system permease protein
VTPTLAAIVSSEDLDLLISGLLVSLRIAGLSLLVGLPLGIALAVAIDSRLRIVRMVTLFLVEVGRGMPLLVLLYLVYYGLPQQGLTLTSELAAILAFGYNCGAYTSELFRSAIRAIPQGQREAAASIGLSNVQAFRTIVLPQALRIVLPQIVSFSILVFQGTALAFSIALPELLSAAYQLGSTTFLYLKYLAIAALMYAVIAIPMSQLARWLELRLTARL